MYKTDRGREKEDSERLLSTRKSDETRVYEEDKP